jgi:SpoVK/Ycf46/Vps4 family AAA+-type ATPase
MWRAVLPELADEATALAARLDVEPSGAAEAAADVRALRALDGGAPSTADVLQSVRTRAGLSVSAGVKLVRPRATWQQLVLRPDRLAQLEEALERLRHQGLVLDEWGFLEGRPGSRGVRMLFAGPPGTGKTLSAEVLAGAVGVDLLVVDISRVVSKWIGETEKNLAEVFDAAERSGAVLFFDEADALFGRRTDVSDAHDRYANLETAYLLARLERFDGLAVLATNLRANIDPAFTRRLEFTVDYDEPAAPEREALWRCHLPARAPVDDDVDLYQLAKLYPVTGGVIRNAATAAGFLAATEGTPVARRHLVRAVRREYEKAGRAFPGEPTNTTSPGRSNG